MSASAPISAQTVKDLRERTGAGMMDCKKALAETAGDLDAAIAYLREKGLAGASKKHFEAQESNTRRSSPHTAVRFRSCVEAPANNC